MTDHLERNNGKVVCYLKSYHFFRNLLFLTSLLAMQNDDSFTHDLMCLKMSSFPLATKLIFQILESLSSLQQKPFVRPGIMSIDSCIYRACTPLKMVLKSISK